MELNFYSSQVKEMKKGENEGKKKEIVFQFGKYYQVVAIISEF